MSDNPEQAQRSVAVRALGVTVEVRVSGDRADDVLRRMPLLWEYCAPDAGAPVRASVDVVFDSDPDAAGRADSAGSVSRPLLEDLLQVLTQRITLAAIGARAGECLMLHAACLASPHSSTAAAFVAPGGMGKTTLVSTLGPGRWYVTDETTVVVEDGTVVPYPKPLSVRRSPDSPFKDETRPSALGLTPPTGTVRLGALCLLDRDPAHRGTPKIARLDPLDAIVQLVPQTSHLPELTQPLQRLAALCDSVGGVHRVTYRESAELAALVDELTQDKV